MKKQASIGLELIQGISGFKNRSISHGWIRRSIIVKTSLCTMESTMTHENESERETKKDSDI